MKLEHYVITVMNYPKQGILFKDITPLLSNKDSFREAIRIFKQRYKDKNIDKIIAIESRGFILGSALALALGCGFVPIRKKGRLPREVYTHSYQLEYGSAEIEMHKDAVKKGERVIIIDDVLATGGTMLAAIDMVKQSGADIIEVAFLIELKDLNGKVMLADAKYYSAVVM